MGGDDVPCACCSTLRALLHCAQHGARLCLPCDVRVHAAARGHERAPLCDGCHAAPAAARCDDHQALLCAPCACGAGCDAERHARRAARAYTGIPDPAELARILYCDTATPPPPLSPLPAALPEWVPGLVNVELLPDLPSSSSSWRDGNVTSDTCELLSGSLVETGGINSEGQMIGSLAAAALPTGDGDGDELFMQQDWPNLDDAGLDDDFNFIAHDSSLTKTFNLTGCREGAFEASPPLGYDHPLVASCSEPIIASTDAVLESMASNNAAYQFSSSVATANTSSNVVDGSTFYASGMPMLPRDELPSRHFSFEVKPPPVPSVVSSPSTGCGYQDQAEAALLASSTPEQPSGQDMEARTKQQEKRQEAKQRYKDKKKNRKFGKQIMYVSRKVRADTRNRVKGRFAKASSGSGHGDDQSTQHGDEQPTDSCV